ncbi:MULTISPECIES: hypothetical protein [unclassified Paenibacillus]|uniref:hypothetical protein n=1 Tax=unclassified Paenibacillus TaxID=185978 RepID=UPI003632A747
MQERNGQDGDKKDEKEKHQYFNFPDLSNLAIPFQTIATIQQKIADSLAPIVKKVMEIQQAFQPLVEQVGRFALSIDWEKIQDAIKLRLQHYEEFMSKYDVECWAITPELLEAFEDEEYKVTEIEKYVEDHLNEYIIYFKKEPLYEKHRALIGEAYELYMQKFYMHCAFSLMAIFENILSNAFSNYKLGTDVKIKNRRPDLHTKTTSYIKSNEERLALNILFFRRVYNVYDIIFKPYWDTHPEQINRNWIAHGKYDFERINKSDILKLFQLLKALSILNEITFESE